MVLEEFNVPLVLREREIPKPGLGEVILEVGACGVCKTDVRIIQGKHPGARHLPLVLGHEVAGTVIEVGEEVDKNHIGKRAVVYHYLFCGECRFCREGRENLCSNPRGIIGFNKDGGFGEYLKASFPCLFFIHDDIPFEKAAIIPDAIATPFHALRSKAKIQRGEILAIFGAGGLGIHAIQIAEVFGARVIALDINPRSLAIAQELGAEKTIEVKGEDPLKEIMDFTEGKGVDVVIDFVGNPRMEMLALKILAKAGRFVAVGYNAETFFQVSSHLIVAKELEIYGSRACGRDDLKQCIDLVSNRKVEPITSEIRPLVEANSVLDKLKEGKILGRSVLIP
jgi:D-arabinose 1-dehydrogenase-like Zn-dependent alcohol dehydrogenase